MARNPNAVYTNYSLPEGSNALSDLDTFCEEWGNISRADATQRLMIAWSKARRGDPAAFGAMGITLAVTSAPTTSIETVSTPSLPENRSVTRRPMSGNAKVVELDL